MGVLPAVERQYGRSSCSATFANGKLSKGVVNLVDANWSKANWSRDFMAKDCGRRVPLVGVNKHTRNDTVALESLTVGKMRVRLASIGGCIMPITTPIAIG